MHFYGWCIRQCLCAGEVLNTLFGIPVSSQGVPGGHSRKNVTSHTGRLRLLDFGAADGRTLAVMASLLGEGDYTGIEYDRSLVAAAQLPPTVRLLQGDIHRLTGFGDSSVNVVTALAVLEHLDDSHPVLVDAYRVLQPGGLFIITVPHPRWDALAGCVAPNPFGAGHCSGGVATRDLCEWGRAAGFGLVAEISFMWVPVVALSYFHLRVSTAWAWRLDQRLAHLPSLRWTFANRGVVFRKLTP